MKLIEIRFGNLGEQQWEAIAVRFVDLLKHLEEFDLSVISPSGPGFTQDNKREISVDDVLKILKTAFLASFQLVNRNFSDMATIRSNRTRRFIIVEDDGLVRICLATVDPVPDFSDFGAEVNDASQLLINTDLFDYI